MSIMQSGVVEVKLTQEKQVVYIYGLWCPIDNCIRYIGKSVDPHYRYGRHLKDIADTHKCRWIDSIRRKGFLPTLVIIEEVTLENWQQREMFWISNTPNLTNETEGGDGIRAGHKHKPESVKKIVAALKNRSPQLRQQIGMKNSLANKGKKASAETKRKQSEVKKRAWANLGEKEKSKIKNNLDHGWSRESRLKASKAKTGKKRGVGTSVHRGVSWFMRDKCWRAWIRVENKQRHLGYFENETDAATAYDNAAREHFGEFAKLNFPESQPR